MHPPCTLKGLYSFGTSLTILSRPPEPLLAPIVPRLSGAAKAPSAPQRPGSPTPHLAQTFTPMTPAPFLLLDLNFSHKLHTYHTGLVYIYSMALAFQALMYDTNLCALLTHLICLSAFLSGCTLCTWLVLYKYTTHIKLGILLFT